MKERAPPSVVMLPDYTRRNPYQRELRRSLEQRGVDVGMAAAHPWFPVLRGWVRHGRPDVVHLHWITPFIATDRWWVTLLLGVRMLLEVVMVRMLGTRVVWTVHNLADHERRTPWIDHAVRFTLIRLCSAIIVHCDCANTLVSEHFRLRGGRADRIHSIPHGHYLDSYPDDIVRDEARRSLDVDVDEHVLLYFGLIRPYKNVPGLIEAFRAADVGVNTRLLVVGNPWNNHQRDQVLRASAGDERIDTVLEFIPDESIQVYMRAADAVVLPFQSILTSGSALLAMSFGRALILPDRGCPAEVVGSAGGVTYDGERDDGLRDAIETALSPATDLPAMGRRNRRVVERFHWDGIAARTATIYRGLDAPVVTSVESSLPEADATHE